MVEKNLMGELLLKEGLLTKEQLDEALKAQKEKGGRLGYHLIRLGFINVSKLSQFLKDYMGVIPFNVGTKEENWEVIDLIPAHIARFYNVVPIERKNNVLTVALADLDNPKLIPALEELTGFKIDPLIASRESIVEAIEKFYGFKRDPSIKFFEESDNILVLSDQKNSIKPIHWSVLKPDSSALDWLKASLTEAIRNGIRRIIIKPQEDSLRISFEKNERVEDRFSIHKRKEEEMFLLLEELSKLKGKKFSELEGRFRVQVENRFLSVHLQKIQTLSGKRFRLTIYDEKILLKEWESVKNSLSTAEASKLEEDILNPKGSFIINGPMGPALSSIYYTILEMIKKNFKNPFSIEQNAMMIISNILQIEVSKIIESSTQEQITLALKDGADFIGIYPLKDRLSFELFFLAGAKISTIGVTHHDSTKSLLKWSLKNGFKSPIKAGILKGILSVYPVTKLCQNCKIPLETSNIKFQLFTRQGCPQCLSLDSLPYHTFLEYIPIPKDFPFDEEKDIDLLIEKSKEALNYPQSIVEKILTEAKNGEIDGSDLRRVLKNV